MTSHLHARFRSALLPFLLLVGFVGCDSSEPDTPDDLTGTYAVERVRDQPMPATITVSNGIIRFEAGTLVMNEATRTFEVSLQGHFDEIPGGGFNFDVGGSGPYTRSGSALSFTDEDELDDSFTGVVDGDEIVFDYNFGGVLIEMRAAQ